MSIPPTHPACPCDLDALVEPELFAGLSALHVGMLYRLLRHAWRADPPCTLPDEDASLAAVARATDEEWACARARVLLTLGVPAGLVPTGAHTPPRTATTHGAAGGTPGRLTLGHARRVYDSLIARAADTSRTKSAAARARWSRAGPPPDTPLEAGAPPDARAMHVHAGAMQVHARASAAPSLRSPDSDPALALRRSSPSSMIERSPEGADVLAVLGAGARALLADRVAAWRREQALGMLQRAIGRWREAGLTTCPLSKASALADGPHSEPARVQAAIEAADALIADARADARACNPVGKVIAALGLAGGRPRPMDVPLVLAAHWARREAESVRLLEAQAAINAKLAAARATLGATPPRHGGTA